MARFVAPIDALTAAIYSILIVLTFTLAFTVVKRWPGNGQPIPEGFGTELFFAVLGAAVARHGDDLPAAFTAYERARYLRTGRVQLTARFYGDIYHASGVARELRNQMFQSAAESAGFAGLQWMYRGIDPKDPL